MGIQTGSEGFGPLNLGELATLFGHSQGMNQLAGNFDELYRLAPQVAGLATPPTGGERPVGAGFNVARGEVPSEIGTFTVNTWQSSSVGTLHRGPDALSNAPSVVMSVHTHFELPPNVTDPTKNSNDTLGKGYPTLSDLWRLGGTEANDVDSRIMGVLGVPHPANADQRLLLTLYGAGLGKRPGQQLKTVRIHDERNRSPINTKGDPYRDARTPEEVARVLQRLGVRAVTLISRARREGDEPITWEVAAASDAETGRLTGRPLDVSRDLARLVL